ncbi:MAG: hypothetical protein A3C88_00590 [Candidatus Yanofskybacteria bacterium RIFCSPHIGHO2_02_FULL_50_12]|uniref:Uncharacterized protein n=1 Tax=Candidatus Yanofskybacteria bacterium RIFCSPHIGHO2_02_FULL_50_12 TaxID=1802685 RepID=A0A1F8FSZ5_9BACT|nr:MAG: hypothetical protein A3C88_00590 [Candidatus Yanofskybacteria bacterium RIFCSPHIGHO2_02_FULL_50_12]
MKEPKIEKLEQPLLNLKTNPEEATTAMVKIEGPDWLEHQENWIRNLKSTEHTLKGALEWLASNPSDDSFVVYGLGGNHRYYVDSDGTIRFSSRHSLPKYAEMAEELGFKVQ